ncbi:hypothetical protein CH338_31010, partial [Rhodoplanes elegans]
LAARRAAQAASEQPGAATAGAAAAPAEAGRGRSLGDRVRALFMTTSVIVIAAALVPIGWKAFGPDGGTPSAPVAGSSAPPALAAAGSTTEKPAGRGGSQLAELVPPTDLTAAARVLSHAPPTARALLEKHMPKLKDDAALLAPPTPSAPATVPAAPPPVAA